MALRQTIRNYLMTMSGAEILRELELSIKRSDTVRVDSVREYLLEYIRAIEENGFKDQF